MPWRDQGRSRKPTGPARPRKGRTWLASCAAAGAALPDRRQVPAPGLQFNCDMGATAGRPREVKGRQGCGISLHTGETQVPHKAEFHQAYRQRAGEGSAWPAERPAGLHLRETRASLPPICCGVLRAFKEQQGKREPGPAALQRLANSCCRASRGLHPAARTKTPCSWFCSRGDLPRGRQLVKAGKSFSSS